MQVEFRKLELVTIASVELNPASSTFLFEARPTRQVSVTMVTGRRDTRRNICSVKGTFLLFKFD